MLVLTLATVSSVTALTVSSKRSRKFCESRRNPLMPEDNNERNRDKQKLVPGLGDEEDQDEQ